MATYVNSTGPLSICVDADSWQTYTHGVMKTCGEELDHCVQMVGVRINADGNNYWKVRNSWNTDWGEEGYIRLKFGHNLCGIVKEATYVAVSPAASRTRA